MKKAFIILLSVVTLSSCLKEHKGNTLFPSDEIVFTINQTTFSVTTKADASPRGNVVRKGGVIVKTSYTPMDDIITPDTKSEVTASTLASSGFYVSAVTGSAGSEVSAWEDAAFSGGPVFYGGKTWPASDPGYKFYASNVMPTFASSGTFITYGAGSPDDIVVAYNNSPTYCSSNVLSFSHILANLGKVTISESNAGSALNNLYYLSEYGSEGLYNIRTGEWRIDTLGDLDVCNLSEPGTEVVDFYGIIPGTYNFKIKWGQNDNSVSFPITFVAGQKLNLDISFEEPFNSTNEDVLPGVFSISASQQVSFARGNVQAYIDTEYNSQCYSASNWRFADNQWDLIAYDDELHLDKGIWYDYFSWIGSGASDSNFKKSYGLCEDDDSVVNSAYYGSNSDDLLYCNWEDKFKGFYLLSVFEWTYLLNNRPGSEQKKGLARINYNNKWIAGYILLPDNWRKPSNCTFTAKPSDFSTNTYIASNNSGDTNNWQDMEAAGAVFLPVGGKRNWNYNYADRMNGWYQTSTAESNSSNWAVFLQQNAYVTGINRNVAANVRLVKKVKSEGVDLGLRDENGNRVLFADRNVGASSPTDYGDYFAWGETDKRYTSIDGTDITGATFDWDNTPYYISDSDWIWTKYIPSSETDYWGGSGSPDNILELQRMDDAARVQWGGDWRTPTYWELEWLVDNCDWNWDDDYNGSGVSGFLVSGTGSYSSASIFLPAAGYCTGSSCQIVGEAGNYWSSSVDDGNPILAWDLDFYGDSVFDDFYWSINSDYRSKGYTIRPVRTAAP